jgi:hypothetical protein
MSRTLQFKRYANTVVANTTGAPGEIIIETTNNIVTVHTGNTAGGIRMASETYVANSSNTRVKKSGDTMTGNLTFSRGGAILGNLGQNEITMTSNVIDDWTGFSAYGYGAAQIYANTFVQLVANTGVGGAEIWNFNTDGTITFPDNTIQKTGANVTPAFNKANAAYNQANTSSNTAQLAFNAANSANTLASTKFSANGGTITGNVSIIGELSITGNASTFSSNNIIIDDSIIYIANNNSANVIDIGVVGHFTSARYQHTGLVRTASDGKWKLFSNVTAEPTATIDLTNAIYDPLKVSVIEASNAVIGGTDIISYTQTIFNSANTGSNNATAAFTVANTSSNNAAAAFSTANTASNTATLAFTAANTSAQTVPQNAQTTNYTLIASDAGKHLYYTQATAVNLYIPWSSNASFANGTTIMIVSRTTSSANVTVTPNTGVTMYLAGNTTSSSRNVTTYGMATLIQVAANTWMINGTGVV